MASDMHSEYTDNEMLNKTRAHVVRFSHPSINTPQQIDDVRELLEAHGTLEEYEIAQLVNLFPRDAAEATALIPSLSTTHTDDEVSDIVKELHEFVSQL